jgi:hypothetical protein
MTRTVFHPAQFDLFDVTPKRIRMDGMSLPTDATSGPNCGLTAMAIAAGCTLAEARAAYLKHDPKRGNWKGGTNDFLRRKAIKDLGIKCERVNRKGYKHISPRMTLKKFCERHTTPGKRYIVTTTGHVQIVRGTEVIDQRGKVDINDYWGKRKMTLEILEIIE